MAYAQSYQYFNFFYGNFCIREFTYEPYLLNYAIIDKTLVNIAQIAEIR